MQKESSHRRALGAYVIGFISSVILTLGAYAAVMSDMARNVVIGSILSLAVVQLFVQLFFFLHLGSEAKPRWRLVTLGFGVLVVVIVVFGSLWIMDHMNYNMMSSPEKTHQYMERQGGF